MPSKKFLDMAKEIKDKHPELFDALLVVNRKKSNPKTRLNFTIDKGIAENFRFLCKNKGYNMSQRIESAMLDIITK